MLNKVTFRATFITLCTMLSAGAYAIADAPRRVDIPAGELSVALLKFSKQYGADLVYRPEQVYGLKTLGAHGSLTTEQAVTQLLQGTVLELRTDQSGAMLIAPPASGSAQATGGGQQTSTAPPQDASDASKEGKKSSSGAFRVAQVDQGKNANVSSVGNPASNSQEKPTSPSAGLAEIIVTAQKRTERAQDVPISLTVLSGDNLLTRGATQLRDIVATVPGMSVQSDGPGSTQITLRGVSVGKDAGSTVGIYVDDVPYGSSTGFAAGGQVTLDAALFDLDRVEVLRGPQGTIYGASTMGGLLKYVTTAPNLSSFGGSAQAGISGTQGGETNYDVAAAVNVPLAKDVAALRLSGYTSHDGGYIDNTSLAQADVNRARINGARVDLLVKPTDALSVRVNGFIQDTTRDGFADENATLSGLVSGDLKQQIPAAEPFDQQFRLVSANVSYDFGAAALTSISSYQTTATLFAGDLSASFVPLCRLQGSVCKSVAATSNTGTKKFTQEVRLSSQGGQIFEWLIGGFYTHEKSRNDQALILTGTSGQLLANNLFTLSLPSVYKEYAAFGDLTWNLSSNLDVTGGVRDASDQQNFTQVGSGRLSLSAPTSNSTESVFTYLGNVRYKFSDHATGYLRYATGYRPGGPNFLVVNPTTGLPLGPSKFESDSLKSYEAGYKMETGDGRFGFDLSAYHIDWGNIIVTVTVGGLSARANAPGGATINGTELTFIAHPISRFTAIASAAYQDAKLNDTTPALNAVANQRLPTVPRLTGSLIADYALPFMEDLLPTVGTTLASVGNRSASFGTPSYTLPHYSTIDLRAGVTVRSVNAQLYVHNLSDERGQLASRSLGSGSTSSYTTPFPIAIIQPRTFGLTLATKF